MNIAEGQQTRSLTEESEGGGKRQRPTQTERSQERVENQREVGCMQGEESRQVKPRHWLSMGQDGGGELYLFIVL